MSRNLIDRILIKLLKFLSDEKEKPKKDWTETIKKIDEHLENHTIFLKPISGPQIQYDPSISTDSYPDILGVSVAYIHDSIEAFETKVPGMHMKKKLENILEEELPLLLSREHEGFSGYYVYIH